MTKEIKALSVPVLLGIAFSCAFAPVSFSYIAIPVLAVHFYTLLGEKTPTDSFKRQLFFGMGWFFLSLNWVMKTIIEHGHLHWFFAFLGLIALAGTCSLFGAIAVFFAHKSFKNKFDRLFAIPVFFAASEWLRGIGFADFAWATPAYATLDTPWSGLSAVGGIYLVNLAVLITASLLVAAFLVHSKVRRVFIVVFVLAIASIGELFLAYDTSSVQKIIDIRVVQPNLEIVDAFVRPNQIQRISEVQRLSAIPNFDDYSASSRLVVTPEGLLTTPFETLSTEELGQIKELTEIAKAPVVISGFRRVDRYDYRNSLVLLTKNGADYVDKRKLVPFGEFIPPGFRWFVDMLNIPLADLTKGGDKQPPFIIDGIRIASLICYENLDGEILLKIWNSGQRPNLILVSANLGWFYDSVISQHRDMSRMRAIEIQRPVVSVNNNGLSSVISAKGEILKELPLSKATSAIFSIETKAGPTSPYMYFGERLSQGVLLLLLFILGFKWYRQKKDEK